MKLNMNLLIKTTFFAHVTFSACNGLNLRGRESRKVVEKSLTFFTIL